MRIIGHNMCNNIYLLFLKLNIIKNYMAKQCTEYYYFYKGYLSQFHRSLFNVNGIDYNCC